MKSLRHPAKIAAAPSRIIATAKTQNRARSNLRAHRGKSSSSACASATLTNGATGIR